MLKIKSTDEIRKMQKAGAIVADVLTMIGEMIRPGLTTMDIDQAAEEFIRRSGAVPSFKGYGNPPFPGSVCASIDQEVVHGIPSRSRVIEEGMLVSIDVGAFIDGFHGDAARTFAVGETSSEKLDLMRVTEECFWIALELAKPGYRLGDLSNAVQQHAEKHGYGVVRELTGHGIGRELHEDPDLPNYGRSGHGLRLEPGMVLAMEPMINLGTRRIALESDGWTIVTADGRPSAHYENTFAITSDGPIIMTMR
ncbi:MAG: type I methionyl aminopeptidase [Clostridiaceae bacterium]|nr:type I methionyl aminopeptidase [Clostridiaceae bacterium]